MTRVEPFARHLAPFKAIRPLFLGEGRRGKCQQQRQDQEHVYDYTFHGENSFFTNVLI
jgi:hypothetical protein